MNKIINALKLLIILPIVLALCGCGSAKPADQTILVFFRYDDYSALSDTATDLAVIDAFREYKASFTIAAIPAVFVSEGDTGETKAEVWLTPDKIDILKQASSEGIAEVAQHGYSHEKLTENSEFAGVSFEAQYERIAKGKAYLEAALGTAVTTFVPPENTYDENTVRALDQLCFTLISADRKGAALKDVKLGYLPYTVTLPDVRQAVLEARASGYQNPVIVVMFHPFNIEGAQGVGIDEFKALVTWLAGQEDVRMLSLSQAPALIDDLSAARLQNSLGYVSPWSDLYQSTLNVSDPSKLIYWEQLITFRSTLVLIGYYLLRLVVGILAGFGVGWLARKVMPTHYRTLEIVASLLLLGILIYIFKDFEVYKTGLILTMLSVGAVIGIWSAPALFRKRAH